MKYTQDEIVATKNTINHFFSFMMSAREDNFIAVWGWTVGPHLWEKWQNHNNPAQFWAELDNPNRLQLSKYMLTFLMP